MTGPRLEIQPVVIDASVALKWQLDDEQYVPQALALRDDFLLRDRIQLFAPNLYLYEIINGVTSAIRRQRLDRAQGKEALSNLLSAEVVLRVPSIERMYDVALDFGLSVYDSSYVTLAEALGAAFWTADRDMYDAVHRKLRWVKWISDYPV